MPGPDRRGAGPDASTGEATSAAVVGALAGAVLSIISTWLVVAVLVLGGSVVLWLRGTHHERDLLATGLWVGAAIGAGVYLLLSAAGVF